MHHHVATSSGLQSHLHTHCPTLATILTEKRLVIRTSSPCRHRLDIMPRRRNTKNCAKLFFPWLLKTLDFESLLSRQRFDRRTTRHASTLSPRSISNFF